MNIFGKEDRVQNQIDIYEELIAEKQDELANLDGVEGAEVEARREKLDQQVSNLRISLEQLQERKEQTLERGEDTYRHDDDFFEE